MERQLYILRFPIGGGQPTTVKSAALIIKDPYATKYGSGTIYGGTRNEVLQIDLVAFAWWHRRCRTNYGGKIFSKKLVIPLFRSSQLAIIFETRSSAITALGALDTDDTICGACHQPDPRIGGPFKCLPLMVKTSREEFTDMGSKRSLLTSNSVHVEHALNPIAPTAFSSSAKNQAL
jgi:hypothetical protein